MPFREIGLRILMVMGVHRTSRRRRLRLETWQWMVNCEAVCFCLRPPTYWLPVKTELTICDPWQAEKPREHSPWIKASLSGQKIKIEVRPHPAHQWPTAMPVWWKTVNSPICDAGPNSRLIGPVPVFYPVILLHSVVMVLSVVMLNNTFRQRHKQRHKRKWWMGMACRGWVCQTKGNQ